MAVRLKDIAQDLGLSVVTVSKVLRNHPDISDETRKRVHQRMQELNYRPNLAARALITGKTSTLGLIVPDLLHPFFASIAREITSLIRSAGYSLLISSSDEDPELEQREIEHMLARRVDALLIASAQTGTDSFRSMEAQKTPYILLDRQLSGLAANFVGVDDRAVGLMGTEHLIAQGCRRLAHIRGPQVSTAIGRLEGFKQALAQAQLPLTEKYIPSLGTSGDHRGEQGGYKAARKLLACLPRPDGIFCFNDPSALGAMRAILEAGLRIPEDVAVVGCGNLSYSDFLRVPLSSVDQGSEEIGRKAAQLALNLTRSKTPPKERKILIPPRLVVRASSLRG